MVTSGLTLGHICASLLATWKKLRDRKATIYRQARSPHHSLVVDDEEGLHAGLSCTPDENQALLQLRKHYILRPKSYAKPD